MEGHIPYSLLAIIANGDPTAIDAIHLDTRTAFPYDANSKAHQLQLIIYAGEAFKSDIALRVHPSVRLSLSSVMS